MALSKASLKGKIVSNLQAQGFTTDGEHAYAAKMAEAIANAVIDEITSNGEAVVVGGSSSGSHKIK
ncbi:hypothetical protein [Shewanella sp.]|uniref:hypothetical protein n=1 Tax=Shewanella sp. TaxID=50422 RepID=UPI001ECA1FF3|nr:hypothetical protein [Shewanella sp.]NRB23801.1 hypothetical protein [Shewanella sp.]